MFGLAFQRAGHELHPDGQRGGAAVLASTQGGGLVEADPDSGHMVAIEAGEPAILLVVGGTGLAAQVIALQRPGAGAGAAVDHVLEHAGQLIGGARIDHLLSLPGLGRHLAGRQSDVGIDALLLGGQRSGHHRGVGKVDYLMFSALDALDEPGLDRMAAVGDDRVAGSYLQRRQFRGAQRGRQVAWQLFAAEAEAFHVGQRLVHPDVLHQANGYQVTRAVEGFTQADRAEKIAAGVAWPPVTTLGAVVEHQRGVVDQAGGGIAMVQRCAVEEGFERGAGLPAGLGYPVVVTLHEGKPACQRLDGAGFR